MIKLRWSTGPWKCIYGASQAISLISGRFGFHGGNIDILQASIHLQKDPLQDCLWPRSPHYTLLCPRHCTCGINSKFFSWEGCDYYCQVGELVYLKLHPYCQLSLAQWKNLKLSPKFFGPFKILFKIGEAAYTLELPSNSKIHLVFCVSLLK